MAAVAVGVLSAATTPLATGAALAGLAAVVVVWWRPLSGVLLFVAVVALLPFGVIPIQLGVQLTLVDAVLITTFGAVIVRLVPAAAGQQPLSVSSTSLLLVGFVVVAVAAFVA